jgi:hypothetical protein
LLKNHVASSLTKKTFAKKNDISRTGLISALPFEIIVIDEDGPLPNSTLAVPIKNLSFHSTRSEQAFAGFSPSTTTMKRQPTIFTFDFLAVSSPSVDECLPAMRSTEDKYGVVNISKSSILSDLAESDVSSMQKVGEVAIVPFLAEEESGPSHAPHNLFASTETPERVRLVSEDSEMTSMEFTSELSDDSEMTSIEFSEADFMRICARLDHCDLKSPLHSTKADPDTNYVVPSCVQEEPSQLPSWSVFKDFFVVS